MNQTKAHYKSKKMMRMLAAVLTALLLAVCFPVSNEAKADSDGMIRVKLTRLGSSVSSVTMTTVGRYAVNGTVISSGTSVKVSLSGGKLTLTAGGNQLASGTKLTMNRMDGGTGTGVRFTSPSLSNLFCGDLAFSISGGSIQTVLSIYIETYLYGVVPYEMSNSFPVEALKAQAISARTYAMRAKRSSGTYDVTDNTTSQAFKGYKSSYTNAIAAVDGTKGVVLMTGGGSYAQCYYTASNGGQTESTSNAWGSSGVSYLTVKDDPYDRENPNSIVKSYTIAKDPDKKAMLGTLKSALIEAAAGELADKGLSTDEEDVEIKRIISVEPHTPKFDTPSRTYTKLRFTMELTGKSESTGNEVSTQVEVDLGTYSKLQSMLSLSINSSDNEIITVEEKDDGFVLSFARYGHGIGLSQRGAQWMAKEYGKSYEEILDFYYPGTVQTRLSLHDVITGSAAGPEATPVPTPTRVPVQSEDGYTTLQEGDSGTEVKRLQTRLKELGYFTGTPLGNYKTLTIAAVKAYQKAMGMEANGIATPELQKMIFAGQQATATPAPTNSPEQEPAEDEMHAKVTLASSSSIMNVRRGPSTSEGIVATLKHGAKVEVLAVNGEWRKIQFGSVTGYVMAKYLTYTNGEAEATKAPESGGYVTLQYGDSGDAVRELQIKLQELGFFTGTPLGNYKTLTSSAVQSYQKAMGLEADGIATPELQAMIFAGKLPEQAGTPTPEATRTPEPTKVPDVEESGVKATVSLGSASSRLNVRKSASTSAGIAGTLRHGETVIVLETSGGWSRIRIGGLTGYVMSSYLIAQGEVLPTVTPAPTREPEEISVAVIKLRSASSKLNMRKEATTSASIVGTLRHGTKVEVLETAGDWSRIRSGSMTGYVMTSYLSKELDSVTTPEPTMKPNEENGGETYRTLSYGDSGTAVKRLQTRLKELGYFDGQLGGNYLKLTRAAVEAYQEANGWVVDGVATPDIQKEIFEEANINTAANATVIVGSDSYLNLRKSANASSSVVTKMKNGTRVYVMGAEGDWYQVKTASGLTGYAKKDYIKMD